MSANSTAIHGQSSNAGLLGAAVVLTAVVAAGALGFVIGKGVATTTAERPAAGPVIDSTSMSGPRSATQKGLDTAPVTTGVDGRFAAQYERYLARQQAAIQAAAIAATKDADASIAIPTALAAQYENWLKAQSLAIGTDFPDMYQRHANMTAAAYGGTDFAGAYANWLKVQAATADASFPDYFQRLTINAGSGAYAGSNFAGQYELWLKAQAAAAGSDFPDWFQRHEAPAASDSTFPDYFQRHQAPVAGGSGGRGARLMQ